MPVATAMTRLIHKIFIITVMIITQTFRSQDYVEEPTTLFAAEAQQNFGMNKRDNSKEIFRARKEDVKAIECEVCEKIAKIAHEKGEEFRKEDQALGMNEKPKLETDFIEEMETLCNEYDDKTLWAVQTDLKVNFMNRLVLKDMGSDVYSKCEETCKTLLKACEEIMEGKDTDLAENLFKNRLKTAKAVQEWLCKEETDACERKAKPVKKTRKPTAEFVKKEKKDIDTERMMGKLKNMPGMPGMQMFNRDDMMNGAMGGMGGGDDYDDDEDYGAGMGGMGGMGGMPGMGGDYGDYGDMAGTGDYGDGEAETSAFNSEAEDDSLGEDVSLDEDEGEKAKPVFAEEKKGSASGGWFDRFKKKKTTEL